MLIKCSTFGTIILHNDHGACKPFVGLTIDLRYPSAIQRLGEFYSDNSNSNEKEKGQSNRGAKPFVIGQVNPERWPV